MRIDQIAAQRIQSAVTEMESLGDAATQLLIPAIRQMLDDPRVIALVWRQFVPRFNDGAPCEFEIDERALVLRPGLSYCWRCGVVRDEPQPEVCPVDPRWSCSDCGEIVDSDLDFEHGSNGYPRDLGHADADDAVVALRPVLRAVFGDNAEIVACLVNDEVEFDVREYSCGL